MRTLILLTVILVCGTLKIAAQTTATLLVRQPKDSQLVTSPYFFDGRLCLVYEADDSLHPITMQDGRFISRTEQQQIAGIYYHDNYPVEQYRVTVVDMLGREKSIMTEAPAHWYKFDPEVLALIRQSNPSAYVVIDSIAVKSPEGTLPLNQAIKFMIRN